jgi:uncharacterized protein YuzE
MSLYPNIVREDEKLDVVFSSSDVSRPEITVRCVLDFDQFGDVLGIEILNLKDQAGSRCLDVVEEVLKGPVTDLRYSYDDEVDAFYLRMSEGQSVDQKAVDGVLVLNDKGQIASLRIDAQTGRQSRA